MKSEKSAADLFIELCARDGIKVIRALPADQVRPRKSRTKKASSNGRPRASRRERGRG